MRKYKYVKRQPTEYSVTEDTKNRTLNWLKGPRPQVIFSLYKKCLNAVSYIWVAPLPMNLSRLVTWVHVYNTGIKCESLLLSSLRSLTDE